MEKCGAKFRSAINNEIRIGKIWVVQGHKRCHGLDCEYDREVDALYVRLQEKFVAKTVEVDEGVNIDFDEGGKLIGLEILDATERYALSDIFNISTENLFPEKVKNHQPPVA